MCKGVSLCVCEHFCVYVVESSAHTNVQYCISFTQYEAQTDMIVYCVSLDTIHQHADEDAHRTHTHTQTHTHKLTLPPQKIAHTQSNDK